MKRINTPCLIVNGQHDELTPACAMAMKAALPNAELRILRNSSHMPFWEEPDEYFPVLLRFLDKHRGRKSSGSGRRKRR
jgi:proline iminopeptidase